MQADHFLLIVGDPRFIATYQGRRVIQAFGDDDEEVTSLLGGITPPQVEAEEEDELAPPGPIERLLLYCVGDDGQVVVYTVSRNAEVWVTLALPAVDYDAEVGPPYAAYFGHVARCLHGKVGVITGIKHEGDRVVWLGTWWGISVASRRVDRRRVRRQKRS